MTMSREEHLAWCKARAHEYIETGDVQQAVTSMMSDLQKHDDTKTIAPEVLALGFSAILSGDREQVRRYIDGFT